MEGRQGVWLPARCPGPATNRQSEASRRSPEGDAGTRHRLPRGVCTTSTAGATRRCESTRQRTSGLRTHMIRPALEPRPRCSRRPVPRPGRASVSKPERVDREPRGRLAWRMWWARCCTSPNRPGCAYASAARSRISKPARARPHPELDRQSEHDTSSIRTRSRGYSRRSSRFVQRLWNAAVRLQCWGKEAPASAANRSRTRRVYLHLLPLCLSWYLSVRIAVLWCARCSARARGSTFLRS